MTRRPQLTAALIALAAVLGLGTAVASTATPLAATAAPVAVSAPAASDRTPDVAVIAHRGSSGVAPENTRAAIRLALRQDADVIENDVQRTSDGKLVILHDTSLARTTDVEQVFPDRAPWNVGSFTLADVKRLDAGSWFAPQFAGERVLTLREWVDAVGTKRSMLLEAKTPELYPGIERDIDKELRAVPGFDRAVRSGKVTMQSFNHVWLRAYADLAPDVPVGLLFGNRPTEAELVAASTWADQVNPALGIVQESDVDRIHALGMETNVWTVNGGQDMYRGIQWGVDGIITNYPQVLEDVLRAY